MKKLGLASIFALVLMTGIADGKTLPKHRVTISHAWARATPATIKMGAAYLTLTAMAKTGDRLVGVQSPDAGRVEIHSHNMTNGQMHMDKIGSVAIPAGKTVQFKTGGLHLMLIDLKRRLIAGHDLKLTLEFSNAGRIDVTAKIEPAWSLGAIRLGQR